MRTLILRTDLSHSPSSIRRITMAILALSLTVYLCTMGKPLTKKGPSALTRGTRKIPRIIFLQEKENPGASKKWQSRPSLKTNSRSSCRVDAWLVVVLFCVLKRQAQHDKVDDCSVVLSKTNTHKTINILKYILRFIFV